MKNILKFQINEGTITNLAELEEGDKFRLEISKFPTKEELAKASHYHLVLTDKEGNKFKLFSAPEE